MRHERTAALTLLSGMCAGLHRAAPRHAAAACLGHATATAPSAASGHAADIVRGHPAAGAGYRPTSVRQ